MMLHAWLTFLLATAALLAIPGPTVLMVIGQSLGAGRRQAWPLVAGVALGDLTAITLSLAGLGAVLAASSAAFALLKWVGAAYLVLLGVRLWRAPASADTPLLKPGAAFRQAYLVTALNPKGIAFFVAFMPQFVSPSASFLPQAAILAATFIAMASASVLLWASLAGRVSSVGGGPSVRRGFNRAGGGVLVGAGLALALRR